MPLIAIERFPPLATTVVPPDTGVAYPEAVEVSIERTVPPVVVRVVPEPIVLVKVTLPDSGASVQEPLVKVMICDPFHTAAEFAKLHLS